MKTRRDLAMEERQLQAGLRTIRLERGLTQARFAAAIGRPQSFVSKYESGERRLSVIELRDVCEALDVPLRWFLDRDCGTL